jgi:anti-sigma regulatory factor (Ser/Thr protein kinase)
LPAIRSFFDFSTIDSLSTAVALIITSDYDRAKRLTGKVPPAVNLDQWGDDAFKVLYEIGFFEIMGYVPGDHPSVRYHDIEGGRFRLMQIMSGRNADELENVAMGINGLLEYLGQAQAQRDLSVEINSAVGEAMINVARHAYPKEFTAHNHNRTVNRWWVTARADRTSNTLTIVIYDQGATIPGTLPRRAWFKEFVEGFMRKLGRTDAPLGDLDHEYIAYSMLRGKTQTDEPGRGEGLPEMQDLIDFCGTGCLRILSRGGAYTYEPDSGVSKIRLPIHIEGTLVEWVLKLPSVT